MSFLARQLHIIVITLILSIPATSQQPDYSGTWVGTLSVGVDLRIVFHISGDNKGNYHSSADSPDQSVYGLKCDTTYVSNNELTIEMKDLFASFKGKLVNDSTIEGQFSQTASIPLILKKTDKLEVRKRPQTPKPPFPYKTEDVFYTNKNQSAKLAATITIPEGKGPFPAVLLITGSGPQDRDETIMDHKLFAVLADHLTRNGYIVLRADDRGIGKSTGEFAKATSEDFARDAEAGINYLLSRTEADKNKIGLLGHSEGGLIAPIVAGEQKEIAFIILLAAPGVKITELMAEQNVAVARSGGISEQAAAAIRPLFMSVVETMLKTKDQVQAFKNVNAVIEEWAGKQSPEVLKELEFDVKENRTNYVGTILKEFNTPWFRYFISFDPTRYLENLHVKVLALNGDRDIQVVSSQNIPALEAALKKSKSKQYDIMIMPGLNHLFQECKACTANEYGQLEQTVSPAVLTTITAWLDKNIK